MAEIIVSLFNDKQTQQILSLSKQKLQYAKLNNDAASDWLHD